MRPLHKTSSRSLPLKSKISQPSSSGLAYHHLGEWVICFTGVKCSHLSHSALPAADWMRAEYRPQTVQELILQSLNAEPKESVFLTRLGSPRDAAPGHWAKTCMRAFDANMLVWPTRTSEYVFCPLPGTSFSGLHIAKAALEADAIIFAPHALPDVDCSESQFMLHMLMGLVKERYSLSIAQQHEDITSHILSLLSTKLLVIDKQMETVCISN